MSHIDESRLGAYVDSDPSITDGERSAIETHIKGCEACGARVTEIQTEINSVRGILSRSGPANISPPAFEDIVAIAEQRKGPTKKGFSLINPGFAAAAVLVLAVSVSIFSGKTRELIEQPASVLSESDFGDASAETPALSEALNQVARVPAETAPVGSDAPPAPIAPPPTPSLTDSRSRAEAEVTEMFQALEAEEDNAGGPVVEARDIAGSGVRADLDETPAARGFAARARQTPPVATVQAQQRSLGRIVQVDCARTKAFLETNELAVVSECATVVRTEDGEVNGVEVSWITQQLSDGRMLLLLVARPVGENGQNQESSIDSAIRSRWARIAGPADRTRPVNIRSSIVGEYRVWISGHMSDERLTEIAGTLISE